MTLAQFWNILVKQWKIILICVVVVTAGAYVKAKLTKPVYQATALVQVAAGAGSTNLDDLLANNQLVQTEVVLATAHPVLSQVALEAPGVTEGELAASVTASVKTNTQVIEIDVQNTSPQLAAELANDIANALIEQQNSQQSHSIRHDKSTPSDFLLLAQRALPPATPVQPDSKLYLELGLAGGVLLGILLALLFQYVDTRIRITKELVRQAPWPLFASLIRTKEPDRLTDINWQSANIEAYNVLRTRLAFLSYTQPTRCIIVTSPTAGEGKSTVAANLALTVAKTGKKTLLIDANLRNPGLSEKFSIPAEKAGLSNAIMAFAHDPAASLPLSNQSGSDWSSISHISLDPFIHTIGIPNLRVMPSGPLPPNPSELLASKAMDMLSYAILRSEAEAIIIDACALLGLSDTGTLLTKADGILLIIDITRANRRKLTEVRKLVSHVDTPILGYVVNKLKRPEAVTTWDSRTEKTKNSVKQSAPARTLSVSSSPAIPAVVAPALPTVPSGSQASRSQTTQSEGRNGHVQ